MYHVNSLFGKPVIGQESGDQLATIQDVILDQPPTRVVAVLIDQNNWLDTARVIRWEQVVSIGDILLVRGNPPFGTLREDAELSHLASQGQRMTGTTIMTVEGTQIGTVADLVIDDTGHILGYSVKQGFFHDLRGRSVLPAEQVRSVGPDAMIVDPPAPDTPMA